MDGLEKCDLVFYFQHGFRSSRSTADLQTVVSDKNSRAFNRVGAIRAVALDISKAFDWVWHAGLLHKVKSYGISSPVFDLISSFFSNRRLCMGLDGMSSQEYSVSAGVPQDSILVLALFLVYVNDLPDDFIRNVGIYADDTTLYSKCDRGSDLWQQPEVASETKFDLRDTVYWGKSELNSFDQPNNTGAIDVKMYGSVLEENNLLRCFGCLSLLN